MMNIKREQFTLKRVTYSSEEGVKFEADIELKRDGGNYNATLKDAYPMDPHEDMKVLFRLMKPMIAQVRGLNDGNKLLNHPKFGASVAQKKSINEFYKHKLMEIEVTGLYLTGSDGNRGAQIIGKYDGYAIPTRPIKFGGTALGFEEELEEIAAKMEEEVFEYIYKEKQSQPEIPFPEAE